MNKRGSGILLHISSLPSPYGIGDLGSGAYNFADFLAETHQSYWQILPLNQTNPAYGNSPYSSFSAYAGNHLFISPERLARNGMLSESDIPEPKGFSDSRVDYKSVTIYKETLLQSVFERNREGLQNNQEFKRFCSENASWLDDYALFVSLKSQFNGLEWSQWSVELRDRQKEALEEWRARLSYNILREQFLQFLFYNQWIALKNYCDSLNIKIIGDIPIYVNYDSADVWANPEIFHLDDQKKPVYVAGVPPDYFSTTGQLWGHPVYRWDVLKKQNYEWWIRRIKHNLRIFHMFRLDHFRGFVGYWQVHAKETTAINGQWVEAPAEDFFRTLLKHIPQEVIIAEDLGIITDDVREVIREFGFPGMKVLLFAFSEDIQTNPYAPHNHTKNCVVYTGTHDNNTIRGWFKNETDNETRKRIAEYIGKDTTERTIHWDMIRLAMMSVADTVIIPMQDILGLDEQDRMNMPASPEGNWEWRLNPDQLSPSLRKKLARLTHIYGRTSNTEGSDEAL